MIINRMYIEGSFLTLCVCAYGSKCVRLSRCSLKFRVQAAEVNLLSIPQRRNGFVIEYNPN